jgi:hypothetical protein
MNCNVERQVAGLIWTQIVLLAPHSPRAVRHVLASATRWEGPQRSVIGRRRSLACV